MNGGDIAEFWRPQMRKSSLIGVDEGIVSRAGQSSLLVPIYGIWPKNICFYYDTFYIAGGYVSIGGTDTTGARIYLPTGPNSGNAQNIWGPFAS